jgi:hypothetical protein
MHGNGRLIGRITKKISSASWPGPDGLRNSVQFSGLPEASNEGGTCARLPERRAVAAAAPGRHLRSTASQ